LSGEPFQLPAHFRAEQRCLEAAGVRSWRQLCRISDGDLRQLAAAGRASEARLLRLRQQGHLMADVDLSAAEASLLLYGGIPSRQALAEADPGALHRQLQRFHRQLLGRSAPPLELARVARWIQQARRGSGRS
jgi:hypothetical protein